MSSSGISPRLLAAAALGARHFGRTGPSGVQLLLVAAPAGTIAPALLAAE